MGWNPTAGSSPTRVGLDPISLPRGLGHTDGFTFPEFSNMIHTIATIVQLFRGRRL